MYGACTHDTDSGISNAVQIRENFCAEKITWYRHWRTCSAYLSGFVHN
jgi:hypothetical protein